MPTVIVRRPTLPPADLPVAPLLQRILHRARHSCVLWRAQSDSELRGLTSPAVFGSLPQAVNLLYTALREQQRIMIVADISTRARSQLRLNGAGLASAGRSESYVVPNRFIHGYGLTRRLSRSLRNNSPIC